MANLGVIASITFALSVAAEDPNYQMKWKHFKEDLGKVYNGDDEEAERYKIFKSNLDIINDINSQNLSYTLGVNEFADLTPDEFAAGHLGFKKPDQKWGDLPYLGRHEYSGKTLNASVDWTAKGAVTPVKNQGQCGSCWSFSTTGSLEGAWKIATGKLTSLSEQQFVDCDKSDSGCNGGLMDTAFKFAEKNAICTESSYSYKGKKGTCMESSCTVGISKGAVTGFKDVSSNENALMEAVAQQPVSIAIEADKSVFQLYRHGVLHGKCGTNLDHGVLLVGYGTDAGMAYWKVKNSWGPTWGESGYVRLLRGKGGKGECGILSQPSYPVVSSTPGPSPSPPSPSPPSPPAPPTPGCDDSEDSYYCDFTKKSGFCDLLAKKCLKTCGCCVADPPSYCSGPSGSVEEAEKIVKAAVSSIVV